MMINLLNIIISLTLLIFCVESDAQCQNISGRWLGSITIPGYNGREYPIEVSATQKDSLISGRVKITYEGKYAIMKFQGTVSGNNIIISENEVIEDSYPNHVWCLKSFEGKFHVDKSGLIKEISGTYTGYTTYYDNRYTNEYCVPGSFILFQNSSIQIDDEKKFRSNIKNIKKEEPLSLYNSKYAISYLISTSLQFEKTSSNLLESSITNLNKVLNSLSENRSVKIILESHTDNVGDPKKNFKLAEERAIKIKKHLADNNILESRIQCRILGSLLPLAPNDNEHNRSLNRRVVIKVQDL